MVIAKPSCTKTRGSTRGSSPATGLSFSASRFTTSTSVANLDRYASPLSQLALAVTGARASGGVTRATTSHGIRRTTRRLESLRTTVASTGKSNVEAVELAAATARCATDALHLRVPSFTRDPHGCITLHRRRRSAVSVTNWPPLGPKPRPRNSRQPDADRPVKGSRPGLDSAPGDTADAIGAVHHDQRPAVIAEQPRLRLLPRSRWRSLQPCHSCGPVAAGPSLRPGSQDKSSSLDRRRTTGSSMRASLQLTVTVTATPADTGNGSHSRQR